MVNVSKIDPARLKAKQPKEIDVRIPRVSITINTKTFNLTLPEAQELHTKLEELFNEISTFLPPAT